MKANKFYLDLKHVAEERISFIENTSLMSNVTFNVSAQK